MTHFIFFAEKSRSLFVSHSLYHHHHYYYYYYYFKQVLCVIIYILSYYAFSLHYIHKQMEINCIITAL